MRRHPSIFITALLAGFVLFPSLTFSETSWQKSFRYFAANYRPMMNAQFRDDVGQCILDGSHGNVFLASSFSGICVKETGLKIRKFNPEVKQNMDLAGTHNNVLLQQLHRECLILDKSDWRNNQEWMYWRRFFQKHPEFGTYHSAKHFRHLCKNRKVDNVIQIWKVGRTGTIPGLTYLSGEIKEHGRCIGVAELRSQILRSLNRH